MAKIVAFREHVYTQLSGVPYGDVDFALLHTIRNLCQRTLLWTQAIQLVNMVTGVSEVTIAVTGDVQALGVLYVRFDHAELVQSTEREIAQWDPDWRETKGDPSHVYVTDSDSKFHLYPTPNRNKAGAFAYEAVVQPTIDAREVADFLFDRHLEVIADGAMAKLLKIPGRPWTDGPGAAIKTRDYENGLMRVRDSVLRRSATQNLNITPLTLA